MTYAERPIGPADIELVCDHRRRMFAESGNHSPAALDAMTPAFREWATRKLADDFGWIIEADGVPVAGVGMREIDWAPHPVHPTDARRRYILNMFVELAHRRKGLARRLMALCEAEARRRRIAFATLHATTQGRPLYERLGWEPTREMGFKL